MTEYEIMEKHKIVLTLFRSVGWLARSDLLIRLGDAGPMIFTPEAQCLRQFDFKYSFMPFRNKTTGFLFRQVDQFNAHLKAVYTAKHKGMLDDTRGLLCLDANNDQLVITAVKKAERGDHMIVRLFNPSSQDANGRLTFMNNIKQVCILNLNEEFKSKLSFKKNSLDLNVPFKKIMTLGVLLEQNATLEKNSFPETRILSAHGSENEEFLSVSIPIAVTKSNVMQEKKRADHLNNELQFYREMLAKVEKKIASNKNEKKSPKLQREKINIWAKLTTLYRAELEARLSFILTKKKYEILYNKSYYQNNNEKIKKYDAILRDIGYKLNTARADKRVAEYLVEFYNSQEY
jgi:mannosylglycerate hydrolase